MSSIAAVTSASQVHQSQPPATLFNTLSYYFWNVVSPKQNARPDSLLEGCRRMAPYLKQVFAEQCWKTVFYAKSQLRSPQDETFLQNVAGLAALQKIRNQFKNSLPLALEPQEIEHLSALFQTSIPENESTKYNAYFAFIGSPQIWGALKVFKEIVSAKETNGSRLLHEKLSRIEDFWNSGSSDLPKGDQLSVQDIRYINYGRMRVRLLEALKNLKVQVPDAVLHEWIEIRNLYENPTVKKIRDRCVEVYKPGRVHFYNWTFYNVTDFFRIDLKVILVQLFYGRMPHAAVIVNNKDGLPATSHVNYGSGSHAIHNVDFPLIGATGNTIELDIRPLLPSLMPSERKAEIQKIFTDTFTQIASVEHPEVKIHINYLPSILLGHKSLYTRPMANVDFHKDHMLNCAGYVATVFLKSVEALNKELRESEKISHPFGEHEMIERFDVLRLVYHFKRLNVMKVIPIDPKIASIIPPATPKLD